MAENLSPIDRIIAAGLSKPGGRERIAQLEQLLENSKLTLEQLRKVHAELAELRKRFPKR